MRLRIIFILILFTSTFYLTFAEEETVTITTYYPSPQGSYNELSANTINVGVGNQSGLVTFVGGNSDPVNAPNGSIYYNSSRGRFRFKDASGWHDLGGGGLECRTFYRLYGDSHYHDLRDYTQGNYSSGSNIDFSGNPTNVCATCPNDFPNMISGGCYYFEATKSSGVSYLLQGSLPSFIASSQAWDKWHGFISLKRAGNENTWCCAGGVKCTSTSSSVSCDISYAKPTLVFVRCCK
ncbi:MAG: hypothetical protein WAQ07_00420 [Candidatus Omnitrophota bacterium]